MPDANLNAWWARCLAETLTTAGCVHVVLCPGSRNSPLLFQLAQEFAGRCTSHWDERGAAFFALGLGKAARAPVAVCVTSGTAVANLLPAVCEADAAGVPLVLLTADRPAQLHDCGAPQTMPQHGVFGVFATAYDLGEADPAAEVRLRQEVLTALAGARRPVQFNLPLRDPLPPIPTSWDQPPPAPALSSKRLRAHHVALPDLPDLTNYSRGLIVAGSAETVPAVLAARLADVTGFPVLADAASGLRRPAISNLVACPDASYAQPPGEPEVILRLGPPPLTRSGYEWLGRQRCPQILLSGPRPDDFLRSATTRLIDVDAATVEALLARLGRAEPAWTRAWLNRVPETPGWNATAATAFACEADGFPLLWLASSMPIRDANLVLAPRATPQRILANRGLNGIDGTIASFAGACRALDARGLALVGDLAALHDLNSLSLLARHRGAVVVLNNGGGAIFDALPVAQVPGYRELVRTDHGYDFAHAAAQFGLTYRCCATRDTLSAALAEAAAADTCLLIECNLRGTDGVAAHRQACRA